MAEFIVGMALAFGMLWHADQAFSANEESKAVGEMVTAVIFGVALIAHLN